MRNKKTTESPTKNGAQPTTWLTVPELQISIRTGHILNVPLTLKGMFPLPLINIMRHCANPSKLP